MKYKPEFISNCSTSSFVVSNASPDMVAIDMLKGILKIYEEEETGRDSLDFSEAKTSINKAIDFLMESGEKYTAIFFPWGINYDNYLQEIGPFRTKVNTCNNINWDEYLTISEWLGEEDDDTYDHHGKQFLDLTDFKIKTDPGD